MTSQTPVDDIHLQTAVGAAEKAAKIHRRELESPLEMEYKDRRDLVTKVDHTAEQAIEEHLTNQFPNHVVWGEESAQEESGADRWIVDPLDGTTNYYHGIPHYGVSIAFEHNGTIEVGVVYQTPTDDLYTAVRGEGAYRNGTKLQVSATESLSESLLGTGFSPGDRTDDQILEVLRSLVRDSHGIRRLGCATTELVSVAVGSLEGYYRRGLSPWDTAAAILLIEESGGAVTDFRGTTTDRRETIVATNGEIHSEFRRVIKEHAE